MEQAKICQILSALLIRRFEDLMYTSSQRTLLVSIPAATVYNLELLLLIRVQKILPFSANLHLQEVFTFCG